MLLGLVVEGDDLELLVALIGPGFFGGNGRAFLPRRRRFSLIFCRRDVFSASVTSGTMTPSLPR